MSRLKRRCQVSSTTLVGDTLRVSSFCRSDTEHRDSYYTHILCRMTTALCANWPVCVLIRALGYPSFRLCVDHRLSTSTSCVWYTLLHLFIGDVPAAFCKLKLNADRTYRRAVRLRQSRLSSHAVSKKERRRWKAGAPGYNGMALERGAFTCIETSGLSCHEEGTDREKKWLQCSSISGYRPVRASPPGRQSIRARSCERY